MIGARVVYYDLDSGPIGGEIIEICGRYDDIKGVRWDDGILSIVANHTLGFEWDYED